MNNERGKRKKMSSRDERNDDLFLNDNEMGQHQHFFNM